jgi:hypothetical protein
MLELTLVLYTITVGFTASAITANLYRICHAKGETDSGQLVRLVVMTIAGPSVLFETAIRRLLAKEWTAIVFWLVTSGIAYWSLAIGLLILDISIHM